MVEPTVAPGAAKASDNDAKRHVLIWAALCTITFSILLRLCVGLHSYSGTKNGVYDYFLKRRNQKYNQLYFFNIQACTPHPCLVTMRLNDTGWR